MMSKIGIFMADGCEEIEGLTVVDIVRRAKMDITMISVNGKREVDETDKTQNRSGDRDGTDNGKKE